MLIALYFFECATRNRTLIAVILLKIFTGFAENVLYWDMHPFLHMISPISG